MNRVYRTYPDGWRTIAGYEKINGCRYLLGRVVWLQLEPEDEYGNLSLHDRVRKSEAIQWLRNKVDKRKLVGVYNFSQFVSWVRREMPPPIRADLWGVQKFLQPIEERAP